MQRRMGSDMLVYALSAVQNCGHWSEMMAGGYAVAASKIIKL